MPAPQARKTGNGKPNGLDNLIHKLAALPPMVDLIIAATLGGYAFVAIHVDNAKFVGLACFLIALVFAVMGINSVMKEMKNFKVIEQKANLESLRGMKTSEFEKYLMSMFVMDGFRVRSGIDDFHRQDDADLIATRKKETVLIQFNHWDEDKVDSKAIQSLHKAASAFRADGAIAVTLGKFTPEAVAWAARKGVQLMAANDVVAMARRLTGQVVGELNEPLAVDDAEKPPTDDPGKTLPSIRLLFVDFAGIEQGIGSFKELIEQNPAYQIVATTLPPLKSIEDIKGELGDQASRVIDRLDDAPDGRYFAIQRYLREKATPNACWLALDVEPRQFPEGCSELITINRLFGFDTAAAHRVVESINFVDRRIALVSATEAP